MREYEITYIVNGQLPDERRAELDGMIDELLQNAGASVSHTDPATRRRLFYPINKQTAGFARTLNFTLDPEKIENLRHALKKQEGVLRVSLLQMSQQPDVTPAIFDELEGTAPAKVVAKAKAAPAREVTMQEVEEKIEEALEEEVK